MVIISDTRQKVGKHNHISDRACQLGIKIVDQCLDVGDYMLGKEVDGKIVPQGKYTIDTKKDLLEVVTCLTKEKMRFYRECERAFNRGLKLVFIVENESNIECLQDVGDKWKNPNYGNSVFFLKGRDLMQRMYDLKIMYRVEWVFVYNKYKVLDKIVEILQNDKNTSN